LPGLALRSANFLVRLPVPECLLTWQTTGDPLFVVLKFSPAIYCVGYFSNHKSAFDNPQSTIPPFLLAFTDNPDDNNTDKSRSYAPLAQKTTVNMAMVIL